ncbi:MAG: ROK family protein [Treponema sp.]|nr:ROK family protein [Treponema sp.]
MHTHDYIGFDIGGTKCAVVAAQANWQQNMCTIVDRVQIATKPVAWERILQKLAEHARTMIRTHALKPVAAGISCGGPLDSTTGVIMSPPNLPGWDNVPATQYITHQLSIPSFLQNDANACTIAEWKFGAGKGCTNMLFLTCGTGLGAGLILNGCLYEGTNGLAGEIGHVRIARTGPLGYGKKGSLEGFCSGSGIKQLGHMLIKKARKNGTASKLLNLRDDEITAKTIAGAAERGDALAMQIYATAAKKLGLGLSLLIDILNPECIIIGSIFTRSEKLFRATVERIIQKEALALSAKNCRILVSALGDTIGDYAAIATACKNSDF